MTEALRGEKQAPKDHNQGTQKDYSMTLFSRRVLDRAILVLIVALLAILLVCEIVIQIAGHFDRPRHFNTPQLIGMAIDNDICTIERIAGVFLKTEDHYLESYYGRHLLKMKQTGLAVDGYRLWNLDISIESIGSNEYLADITYMWSKDSEPRQEIHCGSLKTHPRQRTLRLLQTASCGTSIWRDLLGSEFEIREKLILRRIPMPSLPFVRPSTQVELHKYQSWLVSILGTKDMIVDEWNHSIKIYLEENNDPKLICASSAGPDGKWNTIDDMVVKRDTRTSRVVQQTK
jgi:hypothetical protein